MTARSIPVVRIGRALLITGGAVLAVVAGCTILAGIGERDSHDDAVQILDKDGHFYNVNGPGETFETQGSARTNGLPCSWLQLSSSWDRVQKIDDEAAAMVNRGDVAVGETTRVTVKEGEYFVSWGCEPWRKVG
jgi:hypothetical protein